MYAESKRRRVVQDINLYHLLKFYAKKWFWIVIFTAIGALAGFVYNTYIQVPLYKSDATLLLVSTEDRKIGQDSTLINNYIELLKSRRVLEPVISKQGHALLSYDELVASTTAVNEKNTEVIKVSIASKDSRISKQLVDGVVTSFKKEIKDLYNLDNINIVDNANQSDEPYNVHTVMLITLTSTAGFLMSLILLFLAYDLGIMKRNFMTAKPKSEPKKDKPARQGGLVNKVVTLLVGTEVQPAAKETNDLRHKPIVILPPSEIKQAKSAKKNKRKK
jgi:capsular polysaccharide biosynthesis protein